MLVLVGSLNRHKGRQRICRSSVDAEREKICHENSAIKIVEKAQSSAAAILHIFPVSNEREA